MVAVVSRTTTVTRTPSSSSSDFTANAFNVAEQRRTRKRITAAQLVQLEELYYRSSHPTRDQRDALAKRIQMYASAFFSLSLVPIIHAELRVSNAKQC
jgi:Homeodomain